MNIDPELIELLTEDIDFAETIDYWKKNLSSPTLTFITKKGHKIAFSRMGTTVLVHKDAHPIIKFD